MTKCPDQTCRNTIEECPPSFRCADNLVHVSLPYYADPLSQRRLCERLLLLPAPSRMSLFSSRSLPWKPLCGIRGPLSLSSSLSNLCSFPLSHGRLRGERRPMRSSATLSRDASLQLQRRELRGGSGSVSLAALLSLGLLHVQQWKVHGNGISLSHPADVSSSHRALSGQ